MERGGVLEAWEEFDLSISIKASFSLPLFEQRGPSFFVKTYGYKKGLRLEGRLGLLLYEGCGLPEASFLSGAWFDPFEGASKLRRKARLAVYELLQVFPGLGLAIDPWDIRAMFYSIFLSRNTDYYANTVRWVREMIEKAGDENGLAKLDPRKFGSSYQLVQLAEIRDELSDALALLSPGLELVGSENAFLLIKKRLFSLPHVGPKTVHAFGLFCLGLTQLAPADRHLFSIARRLGLVGENARAPRKDLCMKFDCSGEHGGCPQASSCLTASLMRELGHMAGWFQTAAFLYGALYLSKREDPAGLFRG